MKKRTKITLRTTIYLIIVGLFALTGALYASMPTFFTTVPNPTGVAASRTDLLVSDYAGEPVGNIYQVACDGTFSVFGTVPTFVGFQEKYLAIAPSQSANAGFSPRDVFVTQGALVWRFQGLGSGTVTRTLFTTLQGCASSDHNGITFDHFGTFGFDMLVTCREGNVFRVHGDGTETLIAGPFGIELEGPAVVPPSFGPHGGEMWVADEDGNAIHALKNNDPTGGNCCGYTVSPNILPHFSAEGVFVIPQSPCSFCDSPPPGSAFFQALQQVNQVWRYPLADFTGLGGNVLLTSEQGGPTADTSLVTVVNNQYVQTSFGRVAGLNEGGAFVDCDVPTPTPTPTPTATFTPTPTSTPTATATATFTPTPTATATATPTATATATPTATATATPTATATATPTATATATPTATATATPTITPPTCGTGFAIGDLDAVVGNKVYFWGAQWWKNNHLSGGRAPASFKGFVNCTNPNPPACGGTWTSDPGNSGHPPDTVPADMTVIVSSLVTKSGPVESGDIPKMVTIHVDPGYGPNPGHEGTGTVTAVICGAGPHQPRRPARPAPRPR